VPSAGYRVPDWRQTDRIDRRYATNTRAGLDPGFEKPG